MQIIVRTPFHACARAWRSHFDCVAGSVMSIRNYFRPSNRLPEPNGSISLHVPSQAIALANKEVEKVLKEGSGVDRTKRGKYNRWNCLLISNWKYSSIPEFLASEHHPFLFRYSPSVWAEIGKYASQHGVAARFYSRKLGQRVSETTASSPTYNVWRRKGLLKTMVM